MSKFMVWCPDNGHDGPDDGSEIEAYDAKEAAVTYFTHRHSDMDYPEEILVHVAADESTRTFNVFAEPDIYFCATEAKK